MLAKTIQSRKSVNEKMQWLTSFADGLESSRLKTLKSSWVMWQIKSTEVSFCAGKLYDQIEIRALPTNFKI